MKTENKKEKMKRLKRGADIFLITGCAYLIIGVALFISVIFSIGAMLIVLGLLMILRYEQLRELSVIEEKLNSIVRLYGKKGKR